MIDCLELRCGNWINSEGFLKPIQVTAHSFGKLKDRREHSHYIYITPNILSLAKFELKYSKFAKNVQYWQRDFLIWHETGEVFLFNENKAQVNLKIEFVHQLQNLWFVLTSQELDLSLNPDLPTEELYGINKKE